jgi:hypothetical protein
MNLNPTNIEKIDCYYKALDSFFLCVDEVDLHVGGNIKQRGIWEPDVTRWMINNIKPGWKCLDIGFNIGYFSEILARLVGSEGLIIAFEPNKKLIDNYLKARKHNSYENVAKIIINDFGLSNENLTAELIIPKTNPGGAGVSKDSYNIDNDDYEKQEIEIKRLDSIDIEDVDFIKMDIEGSEPFAWEGFPENIKNCPLMIAELGPYHPRSFLEELDNRFFMEDVSGNKVFVETILDMPHHLNVVLKKK